MDFMIGWAAIIPSYTTPLLLACLGLIISERAGVLNLGAEGLMALGAMMAAVTVLSGHSLLLGFAAGAGAAVALSLVFGVAVVVFRANQTLAGLAVVAIGLGITGVVGRPFTQKTFAGLPHFGDLLAIDQQTGLGRFIAAQDIVSVVAPVIAVLLWWWLGATRAGLKLRAAGENPAAADVAGVDIQWTRLATVLFCGLLCGLSGAYLTIATSHVWVENMIAARGWIAIALVILARWSPARAIFGALLFGSADALIPRLQAVGADVPVYLMMMLPYALTLLMLFLSSLIGRGSGEPAALGAIYLRQDKH
ncbi:ABC transporter permease [Rhizobium sp. FKL33]|uniref:ABC transporter permease n=1 Tax=Rhizobium sp. FKL33 TaxID=2562307 RepID=UPI0010C04044|nr:ABC transporter permease [Rhizobium sp. FKL33]